MLRLKNKKLSFFFLIVFCFLNYLGIWQLKRASQKEALLVQYNDRVTHSPLVFSSLASLADKRFYPIEMQGFFDNAHTILLDNKIFHGQVGYEIYSPFQIVGSSFYMLIDRGFIPLPKGKRITPPIAPVKDLQKVTGLLNLPPAHFSLGKMLDAAIQFPLRVQFIDIAQLEKYLPYPLYPYVLQLKPNDPRAFHIERQMMTLVSPEKHRAYAYQWFALAFTLLIIFLSLNFKKA